MSQAAVVPVFYFAAAVLLIFGSLLFWQWREKRASGAKDSTLLPMAVALIALGLAAAGFQTFLYAQEEYESRRFSFTYRVELSPAGEGAGRVLLPIPLQDALLANLRAEPANTPFSINRTGPEPTLEVWVTRVVTLTASFTSHDLSYDPDLSRTEDLWPESNPGILLDSVEGDPLPLHLEASVSWGGYCEGVHWSLDADLVPGDRAYPATGGRYVC